MRSRRPSPRTATRATIGLRLVVSLKMSREIGVLGSLLAQRRWPELFRRQLGYAVYALPAALLTALQKCAAQFGASRRSVRRKFSRTSPRRAARLRGL